MVAPRRREREDSEGERRENEGGGKEKEKKGKGKGKEKKKKKRGKEKEERNREKAKEEKRTSKREGPTLDLTLVPPGGAPPRGAKTKTKCQVRIPIMKVRTSHFVFFSLRWALRRKHAIFQKSCFLTLISPILKGL